MLTMLGRNEQLIIRDFGLAVALNADPTNATAFQQGDWYTLAGTGTTIVRVANGNYPLLAFPVWSKRGEYTTQGLTQVSVILGGSFMASTDRYDTTANYTLGHELTVTNGLLTMCGQGQPIHGFVLRTPANNNGNLEFLRVLAGY